MTADEPINFGPWTLSADIPLSPVSPQERFVSEAVSSGEAVCAKTSRGATVA